MIAYLGLAFVANAGLSLVIWRRQATVLHKIYLGGRVAPGCAPAEGIALILVTLILAVLYARGWFS